VTMIIYIAAILGVIESTSQFGRNDAKGQPCAENLFILALFLVVLVSNYNR
jgi:hypothetical protein